MNIRGMSASGYRSLRAIRFPIGDLTVFVGQNGVGKTNLYRALQLVQAAAAGTLARELASEGGMESALWAGRRQGGKPVRMKFGVELGQSGTLGYDVETGLVHSYENEVGISTPTAAAFPLEPQIKEESLTFRNGRRNTILLDRRGPRVIALDNEGRKQSVGGQMLASETALSAIADPVQFPDIDAIRRTMLDWRFFHDFRTDRDAPLRQPCLAVTTPTLSSNGADLAAVFATLAHIRGDSTDLDRAIDDAFPGSRLVVPMPERTASFGLIQSDHPRRVFEAGELSDGTLRYLALAGALLGYRLPSFIALNEPEASLHPQLLEPLARLIIHAARRTQIWVVTHSERLAEAFVAHGKVQPRTVVKRNGETWIEGLQLYGEFGGDDEPD